jgi:choline dehydrogenase-like flavoprotein
VRVTRIGRPGTSLRSADTSGKTLGGSTSINGATWTRAGKEAYDALPRFLGGMHGEGRWAWASMSEYMKKSESFRAPEEWQAELGAGYNASFHGAEGPVQARYSAGMYRGGHQAAFAQVLSEAGVQNISDSAGGVAAGVGWHANSLDGDNRRSSSAAAYWTPIEGKHNIAVLVGHTATKIETEGKDVIRATGVSFTGPSGNWTVYADEEVILAAGAIMSPHLLQVSGIGPAADLEAAGIPSVLDLPGVGRNLQEQTMNTIAAPRIEGYNVTGGGPSNMIAYPNATALFGNFSAEFETGMVANLSAYAQAAFENGGAVSAEGALSTLQIQADVIKRGTAVVELFLDGGWPDGGLGINMWTLLPFSRGRVVSPSLGAPFPVIQPNFFSSAADMLMQAAGVRLARRAFATEPLRAFVRNETMPGDGVGDGDEALLPWIQYNFGTVSHPLGTCAMMRREWGGVVDANLTVYGTSNLRIVDASVLPMQVSAHLSATLYGVAENAADIMKTAFAARRDGLSLSATSGASRSMRILFW